MSAAAAAFVALAVGHATHEAKLKALKVVELRAICMTGWMQLETNLS
jgi:hypothetical protein